MKQTLPPFIAKVEAINRRVPPLSDRVINWAVDAAKPNVALRDRNGMTVCVKCYNSTPYRGSGKVVCGNCQHTLDIIDTYKDKRSRLPYEFLFCVLSVVDNVQLIRTLRLEGVMRLSNGTETFRIVELCRHWISGNGDTAVTALPVVMGNFIKFGKIVLRETNRILYDYYADIATPYPESELISGLSSPWFDMAAVVPQTSVYTFVCATLENNLALLGEYR